MNEKKTENINPALLPKGRVFVMPYAKGDIMIFKSEQTLNMETRTNLTNAMKAMFPEHKCIVVDKGNQIEVYHNLDSNNELTLVRKLYVVIGILVVINLFSFFFR